MAIISYSSLEGGGANDVLEDFVDCGEREEAEEEELRLPLEFLLRLFLRLL